MMMYSITAIQNFLWMLTMVPPLDFSLPVEPFKYLVGFMAILHLHITSPPGLMVSAF